MIDFQPNGSLAGPVLFGIAVITLFMSAWGAVRWDWKALPFVLLVGLIVPFLLPLVVMTVIAQSDGWGGFVFHADSLILFVGFPAALAGFVGALAVRRMRSNVR
ncbi:MAG: hypothetical protein ACKOVA_13635 [Novosphingobium sp.]